MFLEQALTQLVDLSKPIRILDLSAAPGGKSTHIQSLISKESLLVSNEVIRSRAQILKENIIKWGAGNVMVTNNDPRDFARLPEFFDVMVVDAPCSGSGLFRRDPEAINEWSLDNVALCSQRQQRILAEAWPALKEGGILIYSTCSYSQEEDEDIIKWMKKDFGAAYLTLEIEPEWGIVETDHGYRFWPDKVEGEGFFIACLRKTSGSEEKGRKSKNKLTKASASQSAVLNSWLKKDDKEWLIFGESIYAWPSVLIEDMNDAHQALRLVYSGTLIGEWMRDKIVPDHALALSGLVAGNVPRLELELEEAIKYLQRKDFSFPQGQPGWKLVAYRGHELGWVNVLKSRVNNYYPKELRILKERS